MADPDPLDCFGLSGRTAIVTGAASGIGKATAQLFAAVGARVVLADLNETSAQHVSAGIGGSALAARCDVADEASVAALFALVRERFGQLDVLVNNAAYRLKADTMTMPASEWDMMHAVIARGTFLCAREAIRMMLAQPEGGTIVNVSSVSAQHPTIFSNTHYDSAKAGVDALTRALAVEFAPKVRVNSVQPGGTITEGANRLKDLAPSMGPMAQPGRIPLARRAEPIEQARAILFLASPASAYVTGHHLTVDGGYCVA